MEQGTQKELPKIKKAGKSLNRDVRVFYMNMQSVRNKLDLLEAYLVDKNYDIICLTEHWLTSDEINILNNYDYRVVAGYCRSSHIHGGVLIMARNSIDCVANDWIGELSIELISELVSVTVPNLNLIIITAYRNSKNDPRVLESVVGRVLERVLRNSSVNIILVGDFNL